MSLVIVLIISVSTGCVSQPSIHPVANEQAAGVTTQPSASPIIVTPVPINPLRGRDKPGEFWATIDPIPDQQFGHKENLTFHGTTNLPVNETIMVVFFAFSYHPSPMVINPDLNFAAVTEVRKGDFGNNSWWIAIEPQNFKIADRYQIFVKDEGGKYIVNGVFNLTA